MSDDQQLAHQDWERAKSRADVAAYECTLRVLSGKFEEARDYAVQAQAFNAEMSHITRIIDARDLA